MIGPTRGPRIDPWSVLAELRAQQSRLAWLVAEYPEDDLHYSDAESYLMDAIDALERAIEAKEQSLPPVLGGDPVPT